jgi:hypothetical protein
MLADKLKSLHETFEALGNLESSTPLLLAQGRGKAAHYGCAIPLLAAMGPALTQAMHQTEGAFALQAPWPAEEAEDPHFGWDLPLTLSARTKAALRRTALSTRSAPSASPFRPCCAPRHTEPSFKACLRLTAPLSSRPRYTPPLSAGALPLGPASPTLLSSCTAHGHRPGTFKFSPLTGWLCPSSALKAPPRTSHTRQLWPRSWALTPCHD